MRRVPQLILIGAVIGFSWLGMQAVHELGHVIGARATGGQVTHVALHPLIISRTDVGANPHPLIEVWAGPVLGSVLPLLAFIVAARLRAPILCLFRFFAGFCLVANGVYIGLGWFDRLRNEIAADSLVMVINGSPPFTLALFGVVTVPIGLFLWHRQGRHFGLSGANGRVSPAAVIASVVLFVGIAVIEAIIDSR